MAAENCIPDWLTRQVLAGSKNIALVTGVNEGQSYTWADLQSRAILMSGLLSGQGVGEGDRVAVLLGNGSHFVEIFHALIQLKAILVPLNTRLTGAELVWQLQDVGASYLLYDEQNEAKVAEFRPQLSDLVFLRADNLANLPPAEFTPREWIDLSELHTIIYSSGTTGQPKWVRLTYGNHYWGALASSLNLGNQRSDKWLAVLPLFHVGGLSILFRSLIYGIPAVVHESFDPVAVNRAIETGGATIVSVVATMLQRMLDELGAKPYSPNLRCILLGGGPAPLPLLERCQAAGVPVVQTYGMTETA